LRSQRRHEAVLYAFDLIELRDLPLIKRNSQ